jgi:plasmid maintenance system antidote protein VapI
MDLARTGRAGLLGISYTHAARLANEEQPLTTEMCKRIAVVFEMTEEDVMRLAGHLSPLPDGYDRLDEQRLVELYRALDLEGRGQLTRFAEFLVADQEPG